MMDLHPASGACGVVVEHIPLAETIVARVRLDGGEFEGVKTLVRDGQWEFEDEGRDQS
jgi:hypothetical protein